MAFERLVMVPPLRDFVACLSLSPGAGVSEIRSDLRIPHLSHRGNFIDCLRVHDAEDPERWEEACGWKLKATELEAFGL